MPICEYGCGHEATHQFKSSQKWCCSTNVNTCDGKRKKDSDSKAGKVPLWKNGHPRGMLGKEPANKGKTYDEMFGAERALEIKQKMLENTPCRDQREVFKNLSEDRKEKIRAGMRKNRIGGYIQGSGRGKHGRYKGFWCDSSWELAYLIYCLEHSIKIERNTERFTYIFNGKEFKYLPDFIVDGTLIEIKGIWTDKEKAKISQCPKVIKVIDKISITPYIEYATTKYGRDFISLYE